MLKWILIIIGILFAVFLFLFFYGFYIMHKNAILELKKLQDQLSAGEITQDEFDQKKLNLIIKT